MNDDHRRQEILVADEAIMQLAVELDHIQALRGLSEAATIQLAEARELVKQAEASLIDARDRVEASRIRIDGVEEYLRTELASMNAMMTQVDDNLVREMDILSSRVNQLTKRIEQRLEDLNSHLDSRMAAYQSAVVERLDMSSSEIDAAIQKLRTEFVAFERSQSSAIDDLGRKVALGNEAMSSSVGDIGNKVKQGTESITSSIGDLESKVMRGTETISSSVSHAHSQLAAIQASDKELRKLVVYSLAIGGMTLLGIIVAMLLIVI